MLMSQSLSGVPMASTLALMRCSISFKMTQLESLGNLQMEADCFKKTLVFPPQKMLYFILDSLSII